MTGSPAAFCLYDASDTRFVLVQEAVRGACTSLSC